jgi:hypothetical protein
MDSVKEAQKFLKEGSQVRLRPPSPPLPPSSRDVSKQLTPSSTVHEPLHQARPKGYTPSLLPPRNSHLRRVRMRADEGWMDGVFRVPPDLQGRHDWVRVDGWHWVHCQTCTCAYQPAARWSIEERDEEGMEWDGRGRWVRGGGGLPLAARIGVMYDSSARSWVEERVV